MQRDTVMVDPKVNIAMSLVMIPMLIVFFRPTFLELLGFFVIDFGLLFVLYPFDVKTFHRYFPKTRHFFPQPRLTLFAMNDIEERLTIYKAMAEFPWQRASFVIAVSFLKVTPCFMYGLWVWGDRYSALEIILKGFAICAFTFSYGAGMGFLGYHNQVSETLKLVHLKSNWSDVFRKVNPLPNARIFQSFEILAIMGVLVFWLGMICLIPFDKSYSPWWSLVQILYLSAFGIYFISQIYVSSRRQITSGIESLITFHGSQGQPLDPRGLPLSTYPTLAWYQKTFNDMVERNVASEQEIHRWILRKAEDSRYLQLGRVTGLFIHDLATPLTIMGLSVSQLEEGTGDQAVTHRYVERLRFCLQQITDFIGNLRLSIRDSAVNARQASPYIAHQAALRMLSYLHEQAVYKKLKFECQVDPELRVSFPQPELNQVVQNLYSNAVSNLLEHKVANPTLIMQFDVPDSEHVNLFVRDNGTGLSMQNFHFITEEADRLPGKDGIGLKLTKRLVELYGGSLSLVDSDAQQGSAFLIRLAMARAPGQAHPVFTQLGELRNQPAASAMPTVEIGRIPAEASLKS
ncbi:MAG TPA: HAMP domain-containing sensor histidine kinase [Oligoflexus sp.]|uniref:sensor histidine kinase n=1 Tax=Oligoflexus sp. TaxID=1971216 RepID=UPI002D7EB160|nr:HAMP domain-containing sensor histidine kinase [Oligoflexus sp.]HET9237168.1 HAMP domain-containing sensor histidine kinase [Oligoflexus sp.]